MSKQAEQKRNTLKWILLKCVNSQEIPAEDAYQRKAVDDVNVDKSKYMEDVKANTSDDDKQGKNLDNYEIKGDKSGKSLKQDEITDGVKKKSCKFSAKNNVKIIDNTKPSMEHLLSDWKTEIPNQPKVKQPGSQNIEASHGYERIRNKEAVYPSQDVMQKKPVFNKSRINQELQFVSDEVKFCAFSIYLLSDTFIDTWSSNVWPAWL